MWTKSTPRRDDKPPARAVDFQNKNEVQVWTKSTPRRDEKPPARAVDFQDKNEVQVWAKSPPRRDGKPPVRAVDFQNKNEVQVFVKYVQNRRMRRYADAAMWTRVMFSRRIFVFGVFGKSASRRVVTRACSRGYVREVVRGTGDEQFCSVERRAVASSDEQVRRATNRCVERRAGASSDEQMRRATSRCVEQCPIRSPENDVPRVSRRTTTRDAEDVILGGRSASQQLS